MKVDLEISLINNEKYKSEWINQMITSLDTMEKYKDIIYNTINNNLQTRVSKLCNLKSRINRIHQIISTLPNINKAITLKSKFHYPKNEDSYYKPTVIEKFENIPTPPKNNLINEHTMNAKAVLGAQPVYKKEDIKLYYQLQSLIPFFNDITNELGTLAKDNYRTNDDIFTKIAPILNYTTSDFTFSDKQKIILENKNTAISESIIRESNALVDLMKDENINKDKNKEKNKKKIIQQAPKSIQTKQSIKQYIKKKNILKQNPNNNFQVNLPTNIGGLVNITDFDTGNEQIDDYEKINENDYYEEEDDIEDGNNNEIQNEDDYDTMLDYVQYKQITNRQNQNIQQQNIQQTSTTTIQQPSQNQSNQNPQSTIPTAPTIPQSNIPVAPQIPSSNIPKPPPLVQSNQNSNIPNPPTTIPSVPTVPTVPQVPTIPSVSTVPKPPTIPSVPTIPQNNVSSNIPNPPVIPQVVGPSPGGKIPTPPPLIPVKVDPEAIKRNKEKAEKAQKDAEEKIKKKNDAPKLSMQEELAMKMGKLKKVGEVKVEEKNDEKGNENKKSSGPKLTMQEEIALKMGKLKKVGDIKVEEKVEKKPTQQVSMMDLLKKQINLRFQNLNKHQEEDSDDEDDEDSD